VDGRVGPSECAGTAAASDRFKKVNSTGGFERICWKVTFVAAAAAAIDLNYLMFFTEASAPEKVGSGMQVAAIVIVPYLFTRAVQAWGHTSFGRRSRVQRTHK
jgi:hypothetical protein